MGARYTFQTTISKELDERVQETRKRVYTLKDIVEAGVKALEAKHEAERSKNR